LQSSEEDDAVATGRDGTGAAALELENGRSDALVTVTIVAIRPALILMPIPLS